MKHYIPALIVILGVMSIDFLIKGARVTINSKPEPKIARSDISAYIWWNPICYAAFFASLLFYFSGYLGSDGWAGFNVTMVIPFELAAIFLINSLLLLVRNKSLRFFYLAGLVAPFVLSTLFVLLVIVSPNF